jgi:hypothetical protein
MVFCTLETGKSWLISKGAANSPNQANQEEKKKEKKTFFLWKF